MKSWLDVLFLLGWTVLALQSPAWVVALLGTVAWSALPSQRRAWLGFALFSMALNGALLAFTSGSTQSVALGPLSWNMAGFENGMFGGLRLFTVLAGNVCLLQRTQLTAWLDGLSLPRAAEARLGALLLAVRDIGADAAALRGSQQMLGRWPTGRVATVRAWAGLVPALMVHAVDRARARRDALQLLGLSSSRWFVPVVAITALALAGRLALAAVPNVSLAFVVVFTGGVVFGGRAAFVAGGLAMALSNLALSGLAPTAFVNVPAMALVGLLGGALRKMRFDAAVGAALAAVVGVGLTLLFSVVADASEWLLVEEFRASTDFLRIRVAAGLAFNVVPALLNGALFAWTLGPLQLAFRQQR